MSPSARVASSIARAVRGAAPVLCCYYGVALGVPIAQGREAGVDVFPGHGAFVTVIPVLLLSLWGIVRGLLHTADGADMALGVNHRECRRTGRPAARSAALRGGAAS